MKHKKLKDRQTVGQMNEYTYRWTFRQMDRHTDRQMNEWVHTNGRIDRQMDMWTVNNTDKQMNEQTD